MSEHMYINKDATTAGNLLTLKRRYGMNLMLIKFYTPAINIQNMKIMRSLGKNLYIHVQSKVSNMCFTPSTCVNSSLHGQSPETGGFFFVCVFFPPVIIFSFEGHRTILTKKKKKPYRWNYTEMTFELSVATLSIKGLWMKLSSAI